MKTKLFYFTGTGNTLSLAKILGKELGETEIEPVTKGNPVLGKEIGAVGILFPVYGWGMPRIVGEFVDKLQGLDGKYVFAVCDYGGTLFGSLRDIVSRLKRMGVGLDAGWGVRMPVNYVPVFTVLSPERQAKILLRGKAKIARIAEAVRSRRESKIEVQRIPFITWLTGAMHGGMIGNIGSGDKKFHVTDACNGCGICSKVCPVSNITLQDSRPAWNHRCEQCLACLHWCPQAAIRYGNASAKHGRYHNPEVSLQEMFDQQASGVSVTQTSA